MTKNIRSTYENSSLYCSTKTGTLEGFGSGLERGSRFSSFGSVPWKRIVPCKPKSGIAIAMALLLLGREIWARTGVPRKKTRSSEFIIDDQATLLLNLADLFAVTDERCYETLIRAAADVFKLRLPTARCVE